MKKSAKGEKDIIHHFRLKRNYLKAQVFDVFFLLKYINKHTCTQIRLRIHEDITNKTAEHAEDLPKSVQFIREHLQVTELNDDCKLVLFNVAFTTLKYMNKKATMGAMSNSEKKNAERARDHPLGYVMERVESDRQGKRDWTVVKDRFSGILSSGPNFVPL